MLKQLIDAISFRLIHGPSQTPTSPAFEIAKLEVKPGDFVVLRYRQRLNRIQRDHIAETAKDFLPEGIKVMVLEGEVDVSILSPLPERSRIAA